MCGDEPVGDARSPHRVALRPSGRGPRRGTSPRAILGNGDRYRDLQTPPGGVPLAARVLPAIMLGLTCLKRASCPNFLFESGSASSWPPLPLAFSVRCGG